MVSYAREFDWDKVTNNSFIKEYLQSSLIKLRYGDEDLIRSWIARAEYIVSNEYLRRGLPTTCKAIKAEVDAKSSLPSLQRELWADEVCRAQYALSIQDTPVSSDITDLWEKSLSELGYAERRIEPSFIMSASTMVFAGGLALSIMFHLATLIICVIGVLMVVSGGATSATYFHSKRFYYNFDSNYVQSQILKSVLCFGDSPEIGKFIGKAIECTESSSELNLPELNVESYRVSDNALIRPSVEPQPTDYTYRINEVRSVIERLNHEWLEYEIDPEAYYLTKPLLRDLNVVQTKMFREAELELQELSDALDGTVTESKVKSAERAAQAALVAWGAANDHAELVGISDRTPTEAAALRRLSALTAQFNDPSTPRAMFDSLAKRIVIEMDKLTTVKVSPAHRSLVELELGKRLAIES